MDTPPLGGDHPRRARVLGSRRQDLPERCPAATPPTRSLGLGRRNPRASPLRRRDRSGAEGRDGRRRPDPYRSRPHVGVDAAPCPLHVWTGGDRGAVVRSPPTARTRRRVVTRADRRCARSRPRPGACPPRWFPEAGTPTHGPLDRDRSRRHSGRCGQAGQRAASGARGVSARRDDTRSFCREHREWPRRVHPWHEPGVWDLDRLPGFSPEWTTTSWATTAWAGMGVSCSSGSSGPRALLPSQPATRPRAGGTRAEMAGEPIGGREVTDGGDRRPRQVSNRCGLRPSGRRGLRG